MDKALIIGALLLMTCSSSGADLLSSLTSLATSIVEEVVNEILDADLDFVGLANKYGYDVTNHTVTTDDARQLTVFRMQAKNVTLKPRPILVAHGLLQSADSYLTSGPDYNLGFYLADHGFDLWFINFRSNRYSRNPSVEDEFNYTFHEMGIYDLPATIDYILEATGSETIDYIGYSQGTLSEYIMLSTRVEYNDKINMSFNLAPIAWLNTTKSPILNAMSMFTSQGKALFQTLGHCEFLGYGSILQSAAKAFCMISPLVAPLCSSSTMALMGYDPDQYPFSRTAAIQGHEPAGTSSKALMHYGQLMTSDKFAAYDYESEEANIEAYGTSSPPEYDVSLITVKTVLIWGENDWLSTRESVERLQATMQNVLELYVVPESLWGHYEFMMGKNVRSLVGAKILSYLD